MKISNINSSSMNLNQINPKNTNQEAEDFKKILESARETKDEEKLKTVCKEFEAVFVNILMKNMRRTVIEGGLFEKSHARKMFEEMLDEEIAKEASKAQGIGLAKTMYEQLSKGIDEN